MLQVDSKFQSTLPRGERQCGSSHHTALAGISIHAPARGATGMPLKTVTHMSNFNPRSREGSDLFRIRSSYDAAYFNPRSREGSDGRERLCNGNGLRISIHAPTRGATTSVLMVWDMPRFQSTLPRGERLDADPNNSPSDTISIHAPTRGAT